MAFNGAALNVGSVAITNAAKYAQAHSGNPGASGTSNVVGARKPVGWENPNNGSFNLSSPIAFSGLSASQSVTWVSLWSASGGGVWYGNFQLSGDTVANSLGELNVTSLAVDATAT